MFTKKKHLEDAQERITELETENRNYTDIITNALLDAATADVASDYVGGLEIAAGALSRAFAAAVVEGSGARAFTPWNMAQIGRSLVEGGESVWLRIGRELRRPVSYDIEGGIYRLQFPEGDAHGIPREGIARPVERRREYGPGNLPRSAWLAI